MTGTPALQPRRCVAGFDCGVQHGPVLYFAHPVFRHYRSYGAVADREFVARAIRSFLGSALSLSTNLPSTARISLTRQPSHNRHVLHLLYAPTISRGGVIELSGGTTSGGSTVEVIEERPPLHDVEITLQLPPSVRTASLVPDGTPLPIEKDGDRVTVAIPKFSCHQMVEFPW